MRLCEDRPISLEELTQQVSKLATPVFLVGDGGMLTADHFLGNSIPYVLAPENLLWQSAWGVAMAAQGKKGGSADELLPVYLRLSQAERERQERLAQDNVSK